jgi:hypothetical protein
LDYLYKKRYLVYYLLVALLQVEHLILVLR